MDSIEVSLSLPKELIGALDSPQSSLPRLVKESFAIDLYRQNRISSGKAAELLGQHGVPYFTQSPDELEAELISAASVMRKSA